MATTLGIDVSRWQDDNSTPQMMNFDMAKSAGAYFVFIKSSQATWVDEDFLMNWSNAKRSGILRGAYHFLDWSIDSVSQARFFSNLIRTDPGELPPVLDYESRFNVPSPAKAAEAARKFLLEVESITGRKPMLYTSPGYWKEFGNTDPFWANYPLWIANYEVTVPKIPIPWTTWTFWQFTNKGDGKKFGAESAAIDLNNFNGSVEELYKYAGVPMPPLPPFPSPDAMKLKVVDSVTTLRVRSGPDTSAEILGTVKGGDVGEVLDYVLKVKPLFDLKSSYPTPLDIDLSAGSMKISPKFATTPGPFDQWAKMRFVGLEGWCAVLFEGKQYMQSVT